MGSKEFDIIVFGAGGFTGCLVARYLASVASRNNTQWALAGRSHSKLTALALQHDLEKIPIIIADSHDEKSLRAMVKRTTVVISLVGPYSLHGETLVKVCAEEGTHYVDLTGEGPFVYSMINAYNRTAITTSAILVHSCGFDSIPSDLTTFLAVQRLRVVGECGRVTAVFSMKGGASGGTIASGMAILEEGTSEDFKVMKNPFAISPIAGNHTPRPVLASSTTFRSQRTWSSFFVMAPHNSLIVRRTWGILQQSLPSLPSDPIPYGPEFTYEESMLSSSPLVAFLTSVSLYIIFGLIVFLGPVRRLVKKYAPQPGEGPSEEAQRAGWFKCVTTAESVDGNNKVRVIMKGNIDPGYSGTARMITECGLALAHDREKLPSLAQKGGFLTPALALGNVLVERLEKMGNYSFELQSDKKE